MMGCMGSPISAHRERTLDHNFGPSGVCHLFGHYPKVGQKKVVMGEGGWLRISFDFDFGPSV